MLDGGAVSSTMSIPDYIVGWSVAHSVYMLMKGNAMSHLMPRLLYVSATEPTAACASISAALRQATAGDTVLVGRGLYAPSTTGEHFPLYMPPGVTLAGEGQGVSLIDGEGATDLSFRPVQAGQSLILLQQF